MSNADLARRMAQVADALAAFDHLPAVDSVGVYGDGDIYVRFAYDSTRQLSGLCDWADELGILVTLTLSYGGSGDASIQFELAGIAARLKVSLHSGQAYELGAALQEPLSGAKPTVTVTPAKLRAAIMVHAELAGSHA